MLRGALRVVLLTVLHAATTVAVVVYSFSAGMRQFDDPAYHQPASAMAAGAVAEVFMLPLSTLWSRWASTRLPHPVELAFFGLNSAMWGFAFAVLSLDITRVPRPKRKGHSRAIGVAASIVLLAIALLAALLAIGVDGRPDDLVIQLNGYNSHDRIAATVKVMMAVLIGAAGVIIQLSRERGFVTHQALCREGEGRALPERS